VEGSVIPQTAATAWEPPLYAQRSSFEEVELAVGAEGWPLGATLALPRSGARLPAVVLVHGSGPHDRNEELGGVQPFHDLAWGLASNGVAVLRYGKLEPRRAYGRPAHRG
jgi:predicted dienelactone hydrolase